MLLPLAIAAGSILLGTTPTLGVLVVFEIIRRAGNYALVKPARETLFTLVDRDVRYKAKNFIDTFVYRSGDAVGALAFKLLGVLGIGMAGTALVTVPLSLVWAAVGFYLGRRQKQLAAGQGRLINRRPAAPGRWAWSCSGSRRRRGPVPNRRW